MKALVLEDYHRLVYRDVPMATIGDEDVLVQVKACGICGSDVHGYDGSTGRRIPPLIMGHEAAGIVVKKGSRVTRYQEGDRITFDSTIYCGHCRFCRQGLINLCDHRKVLGVSCNEYKQDGAFAEYVSVPAHILYPLPETLSFEKAALVEPVSIAVHGVSLASIRVGNSALVMGCGLIGLVVVQLLRLMGCGSITAVDVDEDRLKLAKQLGANTLINPTNHDVRSLVLEATEGIGVDLALDVVGYTQSINGCVESLKKGGQLVLIGNFQPEISVSLQTIVTRQLTVVGSCASCGEYETSLDLIDRQQIKVDQLISSVGSLEDGFYWFDQLYHKKKKLMKVILTP